MNFYPRSPCGERLRARAAEGQRPEISIHALLAESDKNEIAFSNDYRHFYPRSPCGERPHGRAAAGCGIHISIHALLAESDRFNPFETFIILPFLSTLSLRRATDVIAVMTEAQSISIHALLAESDARRGAIKSLVNVYFYPRSPCGERQEGLFTFNAKKAFLSTLSLRRATELNSSWISSIRISIHALLAESDGKPKALKSRR